MSVCQHQPIDGMTSGGDEVSHRLPLVREIAAIDRSCTATSHHNPIFPFHKATIDTEHTWSFFCEHGSSFLDDCKPEHLAIRN
jgi:hypothetical protein